MHIGDSKTVTVGRIYNEGDETLNISAFWHQQFGNVALSLTIDPKNRILEPNQSFEISITVTASEIGYYNGTVEVLTSIQTPQGWIPIYYHNGTIRIPPGSGNINVPSASLSASITVGEVEPPITNPNPTPTPTSDHAWHAIIVATVLGFVFAIGYYSVRKHEKTKLNPKPKPKAKAMLKLCSLLIFLFTLTPLCVADPTGISSGSAVVLGPSGITGTSSGSAVVLRQSWATGTNQGKAVVTTEEQKPGGATIIIVPTPIPTSIPIAPAPAPLTPPITIQPEAVPVGAIIMPIILIGVVTEKSTRKKRKAINRVKKEKPTTRRGERAL